jgi:molybdopterin synthase sulfur carrier subunit
MIRIRLFSTAREALQTSELESPFIPGMKLCDLQRALSEQYDVFKDLPGRWAVNLDFVSLDQEIHAGDEIAFIPPVSGG